ncbi:polysaccharide pyruvyl transferase family protein, partial [Candidatus Peregrinibacteria bacterium]|nr:polysaccharide pyruvyl transferase family protein [Candidatus Peregrinibacteria bacterium]
LVIGMRLHSVILAVLSKTPFIALSYSKKVKDFDATVGMKDFVLDYQKLNLDDLKKMVKNLLLVEKDVAINLEKEKLKNTYKFFDHEKLLKKLF